MTKATLHTDGGSRGNPGHAAIGFVLQIEGKEAIMHKEYIGIATNNTAEYGALIKGLHKAYEENVEDLECMLDSELVVRQMQGVYRVKDKNLQQLFARAKEAASNFRSIHFTAVRREFNKVADRLVNEALDEQANSKV
jgi:ribonuclease HI